VRVRSISELKASRCSPLFSQAFKCQRTTKTRIAATRITPSTSVGINSSSVIPCSFSWIFPSESLLKSRFIVNNRAFKEPCPLALWCSFSVNHWLMAYCEPLKSPATPQLSIGGASDPHRSKNHYGSLAGTLDPDPIGSEFASQSARMEQRAGIEPARVGFAHRCVPNSLPLHGSSLPNNASVGNQMIAVW
jgi:hypothetical protein